jgi:hypothetical protein
MKKNRALLIVLFVLFVDVVCNGQPHPQQNLQKYWIYRERLNDYMINGHDQGQSIIAAYRGAANNYKPIPSIVWADEPWNIAYWIGALAMEHDLLSKACGGCTSNSSPALLKNEQDLFNAIEAVNRLDNTADCESWWMQGAGTCGSCNVLTPPLPNLNGFSVSDDVPSYFNQTPYSDYLNQSWVPPPDYNRDICISSCQTDYSPNREMSNDHIAALFMGFTLVTKFIDVNLPSPNNRLFSDGATTHYVQEVRNIANRFLQYMESSSPHTWKLYNLCTDRCVLGDKNPTVETCGGSSGPGNPNASCLPGSEAGANAQAGAIGFYAANVFIQGGALNGPADVGKLIVFEDDGYYRNLWDVNIAGDIWKSTLAAIAELWHISEFAQSSRKQIAEKLVDVGIKKGWEHLILLNRLLFGTYKYTIPNSFYECLLDNAPCRGWDGSATTPLNEEWGGGGQSDRLSGDRGANWSLAISGVDYLFYFNLYNEFNSGYLGNGYVPIEINQLALTSIDKNHYTEFDKKNFMASNSITAHDGYNIDFDGSTDYGRVVFLAGQTVDLLPGFNVGNGATLDAYIDHTIGAMGCNIPAALDAAVGCAYLDVSSSRISPSDTTVEGDSLVVRQHPSNDSIITKQNTPSFDISIIPNPSKGIFSLVCKNALQSIEIRDVLGNLVYSKTVNDMQPVNMDIDISTHPPGIYFLKAQSRDKIYTEKVVIQ